MAAFGRDIESSKQVWSAQEGYPGDYVYRDFYRDVGCDLDYDYVRPYLPGDGNRNITGIKYYRITGQHGHKQLYDPDVALTVPRSMPATSCSIARSRSSICMG